ncbi:DnaT-like ssDNA-binding domain-containing protein [Novosphingobium sp.]|uniref:DnaT-like ssDNA-binding domain-containing protein n=1 Tax=Novosphingobium sp. TaxID=1874826 RepID=UPI00286DAF1B|nr:DnaT-like ssDNA-binding domain-containing protein [Novosphingobium sp.]
MTGFITLQREAFDHPLLRDGERFRAWFWMVAKACWKPTPFDINGKTVMLQRGQFCTSRAQLAEAWGWSPSAVERFLTRLETEQMIGRATGQGRSVVTICNYAKYQDDGFEPGQATGQATGQRSDSHRTAKEQGNKGTIVEEPNGSPTPPIAPKPKPKPAKVSSKVAMTADWSPADLSGDVGELLTQWPPGRLEQEVVDFREYWTEAGEKRPGWDRTFRSRIRTVHERVMRESRNGNQHQAAGRTPAGHRGNYDRRDSFTRAIDDSLGLDQFGNPPGEAGRWDDGDPAGNRELTPARRTDL